MKITCAVIDDEPLAVSLMAAYVRKTPFLELKGEYGSGKEAFEALETEPVDLLFCDIQMPDLNGIELSRMIPEGTRVIFTTAFSQYAIDGFKVQAIDYLLKPVSYEDFLTASKRALEWFELRQSAGRQSPDDTAAAAPRSTESNAVPKTIFVKTDYHQQQINLDQVLYIEGLKDYVKIYLEGKQEPILSQLSLKNLETSLPSEFMRVHRSYIVNTSKISVIGRGRIIFGKVYIPIGDGYKAAFDEFISKHSL